MNKPLIASLAALAAVLIGLPPVLGAITEQRVRARVAEINTQGVVAAEVEAFDRGWFGSSAKIGLTFSPQYARQLAIADALPEEAPGAAPHVLIAVDLAHGPVAVLDGVSLGWSRMRAQPDPTDADLTRVREALGVPYLFEFRGQFGFGGTLDFDADIPSMNVPVDALAGEFKFSGAFLEGTLAGKSLRAIGIVDDISLSSIGGEVTLHHLRTDIDNEILSRYRMPGRSQVSIEAVSAGGPGATQPGFEARDLRISSHMGVRETDQLADLEVSYQLSQLRIEDNEFTSAALGITARNLDVTALDAYTVAAQEAAANGIEGDVDWLSAATPHLERALAAGPSLTIDPLTFNWNGQLFEGRIALTTIPARLPPAGLIRFDNPLLLLGLVDSDADLRIAKPLAQRLAVLAAQTQIGGEGSEAEFMAEAQGGRMLSMLTGQGVLVEDGDDYRTAIRFSNGALTLNGSPLPFGLP